MWRYSGKRNIPGIYLGSSCALKTFVDIRPAEFAIATIFKRSRTISSSLSFVTDPWWLLRRLSWIRQPCCWNTMLQPRRMAQTPHDYFSTDSTRNIREYSPPWSRGTSQNTQLVGALTDWLLQGWWTPRYLSPMEYNYGGKVNVFLVVAAWHPYIWTDLSLK